MSGFCEYGARVSKANRKRFRLLMGRPRAQGVEREPNGQARRVPEAERQRDAMAMAISQRVRHRSLAPEQAVDPEAGTAIGRL